MHESTNQHPWLTDREVAQRYAVARVTVWRWSQAGTIPRPKKIGPNSVRWNAAELDAHDAQLQISQPARVHS